MWIFDGTTKKLTKVGEEPSTLKISAQALQTLKIWWTEALNKPGKEKEAKVPVEAEG